MEKDLTLIGGMVIVITSLTAAIVWLTFKLLKSKDNQIQEKDKLIDIVKENSDSHNKLSTSIDSQIKSQERLSDFVNDLHKEILKSIK